MTACLQGTLLVMGIFFEYLGPKKDFLPVNIEGDDGEDVARAEEPTVSNEEEDDEDDEAAPTEVTPLLRVN